MYVYSYVSNTLISKYRKSLLVVDWGWVKVDLIVLYRHLAKASNWSPTERPLRLWLEKYSKIVTRPLARLDRSDPSTHVS